MNIFTRLYYRYRRIIKAIQLFLIISGPGIIVMIADNDAGDITTYAATGAKYGYTLIWVILILIPVCYISLVRVAFGKYKQLFHYSKIVAENIRMHRN
ncbi:MAG TPA: hypothetical protein VEI46_00670 [Thermodesulfovibrionales bacterium]|nr:hypothetical protein [Thermodesulfovibrionales bacterium]HXX80035.1 hypothetical protein [Thermodesulfovibrionales bacterium]